MKLLPCPVCESAAELKQSYFLDTDTPYSYVRCTNPDCRFHSHSPHFWNAPPALNDERAMISWNERYEEAWQELIAIASKAQRILIEENLSADEPSAPAALVQTERKSA